MQIWLLSSDGKDQPDALAGFAASAAMACSTIPFEHTISECRVARINGEYVIDPTFEQMKDADLDIMVGCTKDNLMMVEGEMSEVQEHDSDAVKEVCLKLGINWYIPACGEMTNLLFNYKEINKFLNI